VIFFVLEACPTQTLMLTAAPYFIKAISVLALALPAEKDVEK
jgi:hypothetical protein